MTGEQAVEFIKAQSPGAFLPKAKKRGFVCPLCGNGTGKDGDGIVKNPGDGRYYCFKCGEIRGDVFDLIGAAFDLHDFPSQLRKAAEIYGIAVSGITADEPAHGKKGRSKGGIANIAGNASKNGKKGSTVSAGVARNDLEDNSDISESVSRNGSENVSRNISGGVSQNNSGNGSESSAPLSPGADGYIEKCHGNVYMTDYFKKRGIGEGLVKKFRLGFDPGFSPGGGAVWQAAVLPVSAESYEVRNINVSPDSKGGDKYRKRGRSAIFNVNALRGTGGASALNPESAINSAKPVFVCEGIFDALSVMECGGEAVSPGSAANWRLLVSEIEKHGAAAPLILFLDNDEAGKNAAAKLSEALAAAGVCCIDGGEGLGEYHDPNERLLADRAGLAEAVKRLEEKCAPIAEDMMTEETRDFEAVNAGACLAAFRAQIEKAAQTPVCGTGFSALDRAVNGGLYPGLYVLGAASSVGKTTLLLQIADNAAAAGRDVLFFSLEQSRFELIAKSVSRESFLYSRENHLGDSCALSSLDVSDGGRHYGFDRMKRLVMENAFARYEKYAGHLFLYEGKGGMSVDDIAAELRKFYAFRGGAAAPLVMVDYIQILSSGGGKMSDKQAMDRSVTALKQLSRDYDIPLLAVSSFNRMSYSQPVSMEAFKESGAIEYGADILAGLQCAGVGSNGFDITAAKARDPRELELVILKNRSGAVPGEPVRFTYFPKFNCCKQSEASK